MTATCNESIIILIKSLKLMITQLLQELENLLLLKNTELYYKWWNKFKIVVTESSCTCHIMIDNEYIVKFIETVEMIITVNKKQQ